MAKFEAPKPEILKDFNQKYGGRFQPPPPGTDTSTSSQDPSASQPGYGESLLRGAAQGLSLGSADEITALLESALTSKTYDQALQESRNNYKAAEEANPITYNVGDIGSSIGAGLLTGGAGLGVGLAKTGAKVAGKELLKDMAKAGVKAAQLGGAEGLMRSDATGTDRLKDAAAGAALGGVGGSLIHGAASKATPWLEDMMSKMEKSDNPLFRQTVQSFNLGKAGNSLAPTAALDKELGQTAQSTALDYTKAIQKLEKEPGEAIGNSIDTAVANGHAVQPSEELIQSQVNMNDLIKAKPYLFGRNPSLINEVRSLVTDAQNPKSLYEARKRLFDTLNNPQLDDEAKGTIQNYLFNAKNELDKIPGFKEANEAFKRTRELGRESLLSQGVPEELRDSWTNDVIKSDQDVYKKAQDLLEKITMPGAKTGSKVELQSFLTDMNKLESENPGSIQRAFGVANSQELEQKMIADADKLSVMQNALGHDPHGAPISTGHLIKSLLTMGSPATGRGNFYRMANMAGQAGKGIQSTEDYVVNKTMDLGHRIYNAAPEQIQGLAKVLGRTVGLEHYGSALEDAVASQNMAKRNAIIFSLNQSEAGRNAIKQILTGDGQVPQEKK